MGHENQLKGWHIWVKITDEANAMLVSYLLMMTGINSKDVVVYEVYEVFRGSPGENVEISWSSLTLISLH